MRTLVIAALSLILPLQAFAAEGGVTVLSREATEYATGIGAIIPPSDGEVDTRKPMTRLEFTLAVTHVLYPNEFEDGCFRDLSPTRTVTYTHLFGDVQKDTWYGKQLCVALRAGLIKGDRNGNFRPFDVITVAEASKILSQAYGFLYPSKNPSGLPWYWTSMEALRMRGALDASYQPSTPVTAGMTAQMFYALRTAERYPLSRMIGLQTQDVVAALATDAHPTPVKVQVRILTSPTSVIRSSNSDTPMSSGKDMRVLKRSYRLLRQGVQRNP